MASVGEILIGMKVDTNGLSSGLRQGSSMLGQFGSVLATTKGNVVALGAVVSGIATGAFASWVTSSIDAINTQGDLSAQLRISTSQLQQLQAAALATGSDAETMNSALEKLQLGLNEAKSGSGAAAGAFKTLGLSANDLSKLPVEERFRAIAGALAEVTDGEAQAALTADIFGKANLNLLNTINSGTDALDANKASALATGLALSDVDNTNIADAQDALDKVGAVVTALGNQFAASLAPAIKTVADYVSDFGRSWLKEGSLARDVIKFMGEGLSEIIDYTEDLYQAGKDLATFLNDPYTAISNMITGTNREADALRGVTSEADNAATAIAGIGNSLDSSVVDKLKESITSLFDDLDKRIKEFGKNKFQIGVEAINEQRGKEREGIQASGKAARAGKSKKEQARLQAIEDNKLLAFDQETAQIQKKFREKSRIDALNTAKKEADDKKKKEEETAKQLAKAEDEKKKKDDKNRAEALVKGADSPDEKFVRAMEEITILRNTTDETTGKQLLSDSEYEKLSKSITATYEEDVKAAKDKEYDKKLKALENQKNSKAIDKKTFESEKAKLDKEYGVIPELKEKEQKKPKFEVTGLAEAGSKEARETILANRFGGNDVGKQTLDVNKQQLSSLNQIAKAVKDWKTGPGLKGKKIT